MTLAASFSTACYKRVNNFWKREHMFKASRRIRDGLQELYLVQQLKLEGIWMLIKNEQSVDVG